ncbi:MULTISPECIES: tetratricopeptide repeat protein [unclassified Xanthobacter]|uniref:tetratricopeptide repeat protein n=1 Tax=unclassified Xanthobacter TaxID=2623496 RepID=UPI001F1C49A8|nr:MULTISPECIES: tetratricopeptide repeat protein [unclassified Xanthobacter]
MRTSSHTRLHAGLTALMLLAAPAAWTTAARADDALGAQVKQLQIKWETIKFTVPEGDKQTEQMNALGTEADALAAKYPDRVEALIWDGVVTSERASMVNPISALSLATRARDTLEKAYKMNPDALEAGAPTSLGVLYYRVPSFPVAFGDKAKARHLLEQATAAAPNGLDAWYFYGDFLLSQGEYAKAREAFTHALAIPTHPDRPLWDENRRLVIREKLDTIKAKL